MEQVNIDNLSRYAIKAAVLAGIEIMEIYNNNNYQIEYKADNSPITMADKRAHEIIFEELYTTQIPILSEEGADIPYEIRKNWNNYWLIDPIDGTKEFINRNGEFTVNIALIENCKPIIGVIYLPVKGKIYFGSNNNAYLSENIEIQQSNIDEILKSIKNNKKKLPLPHNHKNITVAASRSNLSEETKKYINKLENQYQNIELMSIGSSLKFCLIAEGVVDIYPRLSTTMEWDIAAGHAIVNAIGGRVCHFNDDKELFYNKKDLKNPWFIVKNNLITLK